MTTLTLGKAHDAVSSVLAFAREKSFAPMTVALLDARGMLKAFAAEDGVPLGRADIAIGKAHGALAMGANSRALEKRAQQQPYFIAAAALAIGGSLIPVPGGVLIQEPDGGIAGAIGVTGDTSDNDEAAAFAGLAKAGLAAHSS
ncbi:GlcG/HbpS family heme-binding protein [Dyella caseinilytica]|uniref:Heme-binding protein n=1 Tax=Dyella caseinilytica TaxID=1849581 RepID=A0ABX7H0Y1_9GAMM|nr:heme-binding protein [Dyella caseinilytica]QRN55542.1 heme-binding protein [Dyella caseinilytica]GGA02544.1 hypothetical protein GCM10011408_24970 [Dyella caseinilytica]